MKLSMWMIANRLSPLMDISSEISLEAKPILTSARLVYSTNCAHVYQDGPNVICDGEGNRITLYDIDVKEAFEIIQGVFDYFQDWSDQIEEAVECEDYQKVLDESMLILQNPMILMDGNCRLLAISNTPEMRELDPEWDYLCRYGYSSINSLHAMRYDYSNIDFSHHGNQKFNFSASKALAFGGVSYNMVFNNISCGRLTLLEKNRQTNPGDYQILERIARLIEPRLGAADPMITSHWNVIYNLLDQKPFNEKELSLQLAYNQWTRTDTFQTILLQPLPDEPESSIHMLSRTVSRYLPSCSVLIRDRSILVIGNRQLDTDAGIISFLHSLIGSNSIRAAFSLPAQGIASLPYLARQAAYAAETNQNSTETLSSFLNCGLDYLLNCENSLEKIYACHPAVVILWKNALEKNDELYTTLKTYLDCERSLSKTASALFTHRNTVLYRIRKCQELLGDAMDIPEMRYYLRISMKILELEHTLPGS